MKTYALIPAYNEEKTIEKVVKKVKKMNLTPIVVDDFSSDNTYELAKRSGAIVLKHEKNKGKGEAIKTGFEFLKKNDFDHVVLIDADMQYSPEEAIKLLTPLKEGKADFVVGYRNWKNIPFRHKLGNFVWRNSFNILFGTKFKDTNCGFMALNKKAVKKIKNIGGGYIIENQLFVEALKNKLKIEQVPVSVNYKNKSGILRGVRVVLGVLFFILREGLKYRIKR